LALPGGAKALPRWQQQPWCAGRGLNPELPLLVALRGRIAACTDPSLKISARGRPMNIMTPGVGVATADIGEIAESTSAACISTRVRQLSRIVTRVYDDALRPLGITASQFTLLTQLAQQDGITAVEIGHALDIEKSTLSRNLKRLLALNHITMDPPAGRRGRGLHLTPKGQSVIYKAYPVWKEAQSKTMRVMGPESRTTLDSLLTQAEKLAAA
jgi:DNA-binding MarR family transcriptional regulator